MTLNKHGSLFCLCFCNVNSSNVIDLSLLLEVSGIMLFTNTYSDVSLLFVFLQQPPLTDAELNGADIYIPVS